jgi:hypothetical protein
LSSRRNGRGGCSHETWIFALSLLSALVPCEGMAQTISAALIVTELKALGYSADVDKDESGDPRVSTKVDGYAWSIYFYECDDASSLQDRQCGSYQFYSGYTPSKATPLQAINKWNKEERFAKAYTYLLQSNRMSSRIEIDVIVRGTDLSPAKTFRAYFEVMKKKAIGFRKAIGFS